MPNDIKNILVPIDFSADSANALYLADHFARLHQATIYLLNVVTVADRMTVPGGQLPNAADMPMQEAEHQLRAFVHSLLTSDMAGHQFLVAAGPVVDSISQEAREHAIDLIIMGAKGKGRHTASWIGSTAVELLEQAPCAVLLVPEKARSIQIRQALFATDLQENDPYRIWQAAKLLRRFSPALTCVHIHGPHNGTFHITMEELRAFLTVTIPSVPLNFYEIVGITAWDSLNDFCLQHATDLLIVFRPLQGLLRTLFQRHADRSLLLQSTVPMLILP